MLYIIAIFNNDYIFFAYMCKAVKNPGIKILGLIFCLQLSFPGIAQNGDPGPSPINISLHLGLVAAGPGRSVYNQMEKSGFGQTRSFIFTRNYPNKFSLISKAELGYSLNKRFETKGSVSLLNSRVTGHDSYRRWNVRMYVVSPAFLGLMHSRDKAFYFGLGPSFNFIGFKSYSSSDPTFQERFSKLGWVAESGFRFPANSRFFADLQARYAYIGKKRVGPFLFKSYSSLEGLFEGLFGPVDQVRAVSSFDVPYCNLSFNLGGGIRLGALSDKNNRKL